MKSLSLLATFAVLTFELLCGAGVGAANSPTTGIAYDEIARVIKAGETPPPLNSFDADAAAIAALPPLTLPKPPEGMGGLITSGALGLVPVIGAWVERALVSAKIKAQQAQMNQEKEEYARGMAARQKTGVLASFAFYHGWSRIALTPDYVTIDKPDQGLSTVIDNSAKTYRSIQSAANVDTYTVLSSKQTPAAIKSGPTIESLQPATIGGRLVRGYRTSGSIDVSQSTFFCTAGEHQIVETEYVSDLADPQYDPSGDVSNSQALVTACMPTSSASHREPGHLVLYRLIDVDEGTPTGFNIALERGDIRPIGDNDAALFLPPPAYKETK